MEQVAPHQEWCRAALAPEKSIISFASWVQLPAVTPNALLKLPAIVSALLCLHLVELEQVSLQSFLTSSGKFGLDFRLSVQVEVHNASKNEKKKKKIINCK